MARCIPRPFIAPHDHRGSGLIASAFRPFAEEDRFLLFASGVSNSSTVTATDFARELHLLEAHAGTGARLVYFSTCSLFDPTLRTNPYILHKLDMEDRVRHMFPDHLILRLPNIIGRTPNPHTLCNHLRDRIVAGLPVQVHLHACRYLMDVDDLYTGAAA